MNVEFIIGTYKRPYELATLLGSLVTQTVPNWSAHVILDGYFFEIDNVAHFFRSEERIKFSVVTGPNNDYGNTPRMYGRKVCNQDWMIMTGDDNYYAPMLVEEMFSVIDDKTNFVCWDTLLNFVNRPNKYRGILHTKPMPEHIDLGSFATRTKMANELDYNIKSETGDGEFAQSYVERFCKEEGSYKKIDKVLYVHN